MVAAEAEPGARIKWVHSMRAQFSPPEMIGEDGSVRQNFFRPKQVVLVDDKRWGLAERDLLYEGLEKHGVGKWREISQELLPQWDDQAIRVKAARLLGSQNLSRYIGWRSDRDAIDAEHAVNRAIGEATGCWKAGTLVEDDAGSVSEALAARAGCGGPMAQSERADECRT